MNRVSIIDGLTGNFLAHQLEPSDLQFIKNPIDLATFFICDFIVRKDRTNQLEMLQTTQLTDIEDSVDQGGDRLTGLILNGSCHRLGVGLAGFSVVADLNCLLR